MNISLPHIIVFLVCLLSRMITALYYVEDPDSLRFALAVLDFDIAALQPHFPGYPVFCFIVKVLYFITGSFSVSFAIVGACATYLLIHYSLQLLKVPLLSLEGGLTAALLFFNPLIWIMGNRYLPDLLGVALVLAIIYYLVPEHYNRKKEQMGWFLVGILGGVKLSYILLILIPVVYVFLRQYSYARSIQMMVAGTAIWLIPLIADTGWTELIHAAVNYNDRQSYDLGGAIMAEFNMIEKFFYLFKSIWTEGLYGFYTDRSYISLLTSAGILASMIFGCLILLSFGYTPKHIWLLLAGMITYLAWVYFFEDVIFSTGHVLPLVPFVVITISYGMIYFLVNYNKIYVKATLLLFILLLIGEGVISAREHSYPTAIAQVKDYLLDEKVGEEVTIISTPLINFYLESHKVKANFISTETEKEIIRNRKRGRVYVIGNFSQLMERECKNEIHFRHDPYINRVWSDIRVFEYED